MIYENFEKDFPLPVPCSNSRGGLAGGRRVEELPEGNDGVDHGSVLFPPVALVYVLPVKMTLCTLHNFIGHTSVAGRTAGLAWGTFF